MQLFLVHFTNFFRKIYQEFPFTFNPATCHNPDPAGQKWGKLPEAEGVLAPDKT